MKEKPDGPPKRKNIVGRLYKKDDCMKKDARYTAAQALLRMESAGAYSNLTIDSLIEKNGLDAREGAFAAALFYTVLERRLTIDHVLAAYCARGLASLSKPVLQTLRLGVCQLVWMDGVDDYAAVSESVNLTRALGCAKASGFVNGVLRAFLRADKAVLPVKGGTAERLSVEYSCPVWLVEAWLSAYGEAAALRVLRASLGRPPLYLRANTLRVSEGQLCERLAAEGVAAQLAEPPSGCLLARGRVEPESLASFGEGLFHVQDRASQLCAAALGALPGERVLDVCAAPGGKSFTIAEHMENSGELVARDLHQKRARMVQCGAKRLGLSIIHASAGDAAVYDASLGSFDRVLCDVPCSGFGVIRRKPEIKYKPQKSVEGLPEIQYKILKTSTHYLKSGGTLVYSTCTLLPAENEQVVQRLLEEADGAFDLVEQRTYTGGDADTDGFFVSVLKKR